MPCTLNTILAGESGACEESFSGVGSRIYIGLVSDLLKTPTKEDTDEEKAEFLPDAFGNSMPKLVAWDIEEETGEVTYETNPGGGGFTNKVEVTIRKRMHDVAHDLRILNNTKFFVLVPAAQGYYVFYSVHGSAKIESATGTTGKASSDEHGHTITISAGPMYYPMMTWVPGFEIDVNEGGSGSALQTSVTWTDDSIQVKSGSVFLSKGQSVEDNSKITILSGDKTFKTVTVGGKPATIAADKKSATAYVSGASVSIAVTYES